MTLALRLPPLISTPLRPLPEIRLRAAGVVPPIRLVELETMMTPSFKPL